VADDELEKTLIDQADHAPQRTTARQLAMDNKISKKEKASKKR
jgi:hypothetical protein